MIPTMESSGAQVQICYLCFAIKLCRVLRSLPCSAICYAGSFEALAKKEAKKKDGKFGYFLIFDLSF